MSRVFLKRRMGPSLFPIAVLGCVALALLSFRLIPVPRPAVGPPSPEQQLLLRSERLVGKIADVNASLSFSLQPGGQSSRKGAPAPFVQVDCNTPDGEHLASLNWDRNTGELAALSRQLPSDRDAPDRPLTQAEAKAKALHWLRRLELIERDAEEVSVAPGATPEGPWDVRIRSARRRIRVAIQRRTGELLWLVSHVRSEER